MLRSFAFKCTVLVMGWVLLAIGCAQIPAYTFWPAIFGALTLPLALALHPLRLTTAAEPATAGPVVRVLSANVRIFNVYPQLRNAGLQSSKEMVRWLAESPADVLCLQEFYNEPAGTKSADGDVFRTLEKIGQRAGRESFLSKTLTNSAGAEFGMAIFSRYPIVNRGTIQFGKLTQNHGMWADLRLPSHDTIRVYSFHLQSMSMDERDIVDSYSSKTGLKKKGLGLLRRFKRGAVQRHSQIDTLVARFAKCPYPILLCADLNDVPHSYSYDQLADRFQNAWTSVGNGVGSTYNGRIPFLRIDNQFAGPRWLVRDFWVNYEIPYSDHFPTTATYQLQPKE